MPTISNSNNIVSKIAVSTDLRIFFSSRITSVSTSTLILEMATVANNYIQAETVKLCVKL